jgi:transcriptional regulator GlxA family with amidase domain
LSIPALYSAEERGDTGAIDIIDSDPAMQLTVLTLDGVFDTGLAAMLDVFATANELSRLKREGAPPFQVTLAGMRARVRSAHGFGIPAMRIEQAPPADIVLLPALGTKTPEVLLPALARPDVADGIAWLKESAAHGADVAAACISTFVLAESGLLDGEDATTAWWLAPLFRERYPAVRLDAARMVVDSGRCLTSGAALSHLDLALHIVRQRSPDLAALVARYLIVDQRPSQSAYAITHHLAHADPLVQRFDRWARARLGERIVLEDAAAALATSKRTLARRLQQVLGKTPVEHLQDLRIEQAVHLIRTSADSVERIAAAVGYSDGATLRTLLRRRLGKGVRELRAA